MYGSGSDRAQHLAEPKPGRGGSFQKESACFLQAKARQRELQEERDQPGASDGARQLRTLRFWGTGLGDIPCGVATSDTKHECSEGPRPYQRSSAICYLAETRPIPQSGASAKTPSKSCRRFSGSCRSHSSFTPLQRPCRNICLGRCLSAMRILCRFRTCGNLLGGCVVVQSSSSDCNGSGRSSRRSRQS